MSTSIIERENVRGYEELVYRADENEFRIGGIGKNWTRIVTDGYDSDIVLREVKAKDIVMYRDEENTLYIVNKGSINGLIKGYERGSGVYEPASGGVSLPLYDSSVVKVYLEDKKGVRTQIDVEGYLGKVKEKVGEILSASGYGSVEELILRGDKWIRNEVLGIYKNESYDLEIEGTMLNDKIKGGDGADTIYGGEGKDKLYGEGGNDVIYGGSGDDTLYGKAGDDVLYGGEGDDRIYGGDGDDEIYGGVGNDRIYGERGNNRIVLDRNSGWDTIYSGKGEDELYFGDITDYGSGDIQYMKEGSDLVIGYGDRDANGEFINKVSLNKYLKNPEKSSIKYMAFGDEGIHYEILSEAVLSFNGGMDRKNKINGTKIRDYIVGGDMKDTLKGNSGDDTIYGYGGNDKIYGDNGNDKLYGGDGNDTIKGGNGDDYIEGGVGDDRIYGGAGNNRVVMHRGDGNDYVYMDKKGVTEIEIADGLVSDVSYEKNGKNLVIRYSDGDSITITNYFKTKNAQELLGGGIAMSDGRIEFSGIEIGGQLQSNGIYRYEGSATTSNLITTTGKKFAVVETGDGNNTVYMNSSYGSVNSGTGNDTVYIKGSNTTVKTGGGDDIIYINSKDNVVDTGEGNNQVYINKTSSVIGGSGDDVYEIKGLNYGVSIKDSGGRDEIRIGEKRSNINFYYDVEIGDDGRIVSGSDDLYILKDSELKKVSKGTEKGTEVSGYFSGETDGGIERIYSKEGWYISKTDIDMVRQQVAGWLYNNDYMSTDEVLASGDKSAIESMLGIYQNADNYWSAGTTNVQV